MHLATRKLGLARPEDRQQNKTRSPIAVLQVPSSAGVFVIAEGGFGEPGLAMILPSVASVTEDGSKTDAGGPMLAGPWGRNSESLMTSGCNPSYDRDNTARDEGQGGKLTDSWQMTLCPFRAHNMLRTTDMNHNKFNVHASHG